MRWSVVAGWENGGTGSFLGHRFLHVVLRHCLVYAFWSAPSEQLFVVLEICFCPSNWYRVRHNDR